MISIFKSIYAWFNSSSMGFLQQFINWYINICTDSLEKGRFWFTNLRPVTLISLVWHLCRRLFCMHMIELFNACAFRIEASYIGHSGSLHCVFALNYPGEIHDCRYSKQCQKYISEALYYFKYHLTLSTRHPAKPGWAYINIYIATYSTYL